MKTKKPVETKPKENSKPSDNKSKEQTNSNKTLDLNKPSNNSKSYSYFNNNYGYNNWNRGYNGGYSGFSSLNNNYYYSVPGNSNGSFLNHLLLGYLLFRPNSHPTYSTNNIYQDPTALSYEGNNGFVTPVPTKSYNNEDIEKKPKKDYKALIAIGLLVSPLIFSGIFLFIKSFINR